MNLFSSTNPNDTIILKIKKSMKTKALNIPLLILSGILLTNCNFIKILNSKKDEKMTFTPGSKEITYSENQIILETEFSDGIIRNFLFDLGSPISIVFFDKTLENIIADEKPLKNIGNTKSASGANIKREYIHWGKLKTKLFELENSFLSSMKRTDPFACKKLSGLWGSDIFSPDFRGDNNKIVLIHMQDSTISIMDSLPEIDEWIPINVKFNKLSQIKIVIYFDNNPVTFYFDTGFSGCLAITRETYKTLTEDADLLYNKKMLYGYIHSSLSGVQTDTAFIALCNPDLAKSITSDSIPIFSTESLIVNALGMEYLRRYNLLIDYQKNKFYLQSNPNYKQPKKTFYIYKGFKARNMDENIIMVINMEVDGPAEKAGLKVGDQILSINNIKADEEDNCEVVKLFSEIYGNSTHNEVTVKRGNEILKFKL